MDCVFRRFSLPLTAPLETAAGRIEAREGFLVRLTADGGVGVGEATPLPGWTESLATCREALETACGRLREADVRATLDALTETPAARHGIALARADLRARRAGVPLYRSLGATGSVGSVPVNATLGDGSTEETVAAAEDAIAAGFSCLKLKVGVGDVAADIERLAAVRRAVGPAIGLRVDANGAWTRTQADEAIEGLAEVGVDYLEQPLPADDLDGLATLRDGPIEIALDESLAHARPEEILDRDAADRLILKPMVLGGPDRAARHAGLAAEHGVATTVTTTVDAVVARVGAVHLAAAIDPGAHAGVATGGRLRSDLAPDPTTVEAGAITVPQSTGLGVEVRGWAA